MDHVDLYQAHGPDRRTELAELVAFFDDAVASGRTRYVGLSNFTGWQIAAVAGQAPDRVRRAFVAHQPQYSLLVREAELEVIPAATHFGMGALAWGPLGGGWLTGKYQRDQPPPQGSRLGDDPNRGSEAWSRRANEHTWAVFDVLHAQAEQAGVTAAQAALAWLTDRPGVGAAIMGVRDVAQLRSLLPAGDLHLSAEATARLDEVSAPHTPDYPYQFAAQLAERTA